MKKGFADSLKVRSGSKARRNERQKVRTDGTCRNSGWEAE
jgi:hypothetical protein